MDRWTARITRALARWGSRRARRRPRVDPPRRREHSHLRTVRELLAAEACGQARLALARHDDHTAQRQLDHAAGICATHPQVVELRARLALDAGDPAAALAALERLARPNARHRMLMQFARLQTGRRAMAQLDLHEWSRQANCPPAARVLLAWLFWQDGAADAARATLRRRPELEHDAQALQLRLLIELDANHANAADRVANRLRLRHGHDPQVRRFLHTLHGPAPDERAMPTLAMIDELAGDLARRPRLIPTLVVAQRHRPNAGRIELLRRAMARIVDDLADPTDALAALAELAHLAGDADDARRWARRGLRRRPYAARLALLLDELADAEPAESPQSGPPPVAILRQVAQTHPDYADVQHRLVMRYHRLGLGELARRQLGRWRRRRPADPLAQRTQRELAA